MSTPQAALPARAGLKLPVMSWGRAGADVMLCRGAGAVRRERPGLRQGLHNALHQRAVAHGRVPELWLDLQPLW